MADPTDKKAQSLLARHEAGKSCRQGVFDSLWQELSWFLQPRKTQIQSKHTPYADQNFYLFNTTAVDANLALASGQLQYVTPASELWMKFEYPEQARAQNDGETPDDAAQWYQQVTEIVARELARSNFYTEIHEFYLDRGAFGTCALHVEKGKRQSLNFQNLMIGSYWIDEDEEGYVDTVYREFKMTARQAVQKFGEDNVGEAIRKAVKEPQTMDQKFTFVHAVYPRRDDERDYRKRDPKNKAVASCYISVEDKKIVEEGGYDEMPTMVSRYLTWGEEVYGYCPAIDALPTIRQVNFIEKQMDALAETAAFPRMLIPSNLADSVDLRAAGVTIFDENNPQAMPKEWMTAGRYDIGKERIETKDEAIKRFFHVDLFRMFSGLERDITAYQAMQMAAEKLVLFSPTFARLTTDTLSPLLQRVFSILYRDGYFPEAPESVFAQSRDGLGMELVLPQVVYTSKVALAIKALENRAFVEFMGIVAPAATIDPSIMDNIDLDKAARQIARNSGLPASVMRPADAVAQMREARAQAQAQQQAIASAQGIAKAAKDMGSTPASFREQIASSMGPMAQ